MKREADKLSGSLILNVVVGQLATVRFVVTHLAHLSH